MKKSIIAAGAASIALAAMPVVSTFAVPATTSVKDSVNVTLDPTCTMVRSGANGSTSEGFAAAGTWAGPEGTEQSPAAKTDGTYTVASMSAGAAANLGTSTFTIVCNDTTNGHSLSVAATGLRRGETNDYIDYATPAVAAGTSSWNIEITDVSGFGTGEGVIQPTEGVINIPYTNHAGTATLYGNPTKSTQSVGNATFKTTYRVGTSTTQAAGTYTGSATYTLTYGA